MKRLIQIIEAIAARIGFAAPGLAGPEINAAPGGVLVGGRPAPGLAVHGFDVVAYFTEGKPVQGDAKFATVYKGATWRFASQANLDSFKANPTKYEPAYGGYCAYGIAVGAKFDGDPRHWKIVDDTLYLNLDEGVQEAWLKDVPGAIGKANTNWRRLATKAPMEFQQDAA